MGLFSPVWMRGNEIRAVKFLSKCRNEAALQAAAHDAPSAVVRERATARLRELAEEPERRKALMEAADDIAGALPTAHKYYTRALETDFLSAYRRLPEADRQPGKAVVCKADGAAFERLYLNARLTAILPEPFVPTGDSANAQYALCVSVFDTAISQYHTGQRACQRHVTFRLYDRGKGRLVMERALTGPLPPGQVIVSGVGARSLDAFDGRGFTGGSGARLRSAHAAIPHTGIRHKA